MSSKLRVVAVETRSPTPSSPSSPRHAKRLESRARWERLWLTNPRQFDPIRNARRRLEQQRLRKTLASLAPLHGKVVADLGCGEGWLSLLLAEAGATVYACDVALNALEKVPTHPRIHKTQTFLPHSELPDDAFDLVFCVHLLAELPPEDHRLMVAEIYRLLKPSGQAFCSLDLDVYSHGALDRFEALLQTELTLLETQYDCHRWHLTLQHLLQRISFDAVERWKQGDVLCQWLERVNRWLVGRRGVSHALVTARRRNVFRQG